MLLHSANIGERALQIPVHSGRGVREAQRLRFDAVHEDDAYARKRIVVQLADSRLHHVAPGESLTVQRCAFSLE
jgi:hypothetical protein